MSHYRPQRVGERLQEELAELLLSEVKDPRLGFATVTEVRMSSDLSHARVFVSILGDDEERRESMEALRHASGFLRRAIGQRVRLRHVPELHFELDETLDKSERIEELLEEVRGDDDEGEGDAEGGRADARDDAGAEVDHGGADPDGGDDGRDADGRHPVANDEESTP